MPSVLNSREWAVAIWLAIGLVMCLSRRDLRTGFRQLVVIIAHPKLLIPLLLMGAYVEVLVMIGASLGVWRLDLAAGTIVWFFGSALVLFVGSVDAPKNPHYMRRALTRAVGVSALVEGFVNFYVFPLGVELVAVPTVVLLAATAAFTNAKPELAQLRGPINRLVGVLGLALLVFVAVRLVNTLSEPTLAHLLRGIALPVWLSVALVPFTYLVGLFATYESAFLRLRFARPASAEALRRAKWALLVGARGRAHDVVDLGPPWTGRLVSAPTFSDARRVVGELRAQREK